MGGHGLLFSGLDWPWLTVPLVNGLFALYLLRESSRPLKLLEAIGRKRGCLRPGGVVDRKAVSDRVFADDEAVPLPSGVSDDQSSSLVIAMFEPWSSPEVMAPERRKVE